MNTLREQTDKIGEDIFKWLFSNEVDIGVAIVGIARVLAALVASEEDPQRAREAVDNILDHTARVTGDAQ
jgi:hypothetical protein